MLPTRWLGRLRLSRPPARPGGKRPPRQAGLGPRLEILEDRVAPSFATTTTASVGPATFAPFTLIQTETVRTHTNVTGVGPLNGATTPPQTITITDGGQTQTVLIDANGNATATFHFSI